MQDWVTFAMTIGVFISISIWVTNYYKEGLDTTPMDVVQSQQGEIESIHKQLINLKLNISKDVIKELQDAIDKTTDQINILQSNIPNEEVRKYIQE